MPPVSPLPLSDRIGDAVAAKLAAIVSDGATFSFTPAEVAFQEDLRVDKLSKSKTLVYWLIEDDRRVEEKANRTHEYRDYITIAALYLGSKVPSGMTRRTVRNCLIQDIHRALTADVSLGGIARNVEVTEYARIFQIDNTTEWFGVTAFAVVTSKETRF